MHIQTLRGQGFGTKAIIASYRDKNWMSLITLQTVCRQVDETGSAVMQVAID